MTTTQVAVRLPTGLVERVDELALGEDAAALGPDKMVEACTALQRALGCV